MSKKSKKAERKKKKRQERIRQDKHQRSLTPVVPSFFDNDDEDDVRAMDTERWLRGNALRTGSWEVGMAELAQALQAIRALEPVVGPGELAGASAAERAQELAFQCMEARDKDEEAILARAALEIDATNVDARRMVIIDESAGDSDACYRRLQELLDHAGPALDQTLVTATDGKLSRLLSARPFLRVLQSLMMEAAQQHDLELLMPVMERHIGFDQDSSWVVIGRVLSYLDEEERWDCTARLRKLALIGEVGRRLLDGLLALRQGDRRAASDLVHQAFTLNPFLRRQLRDAGYSSMSELGYQATTIAVGLQPLIDDLPDFNDWLADGMPWMDQAARDRALKAYDKPLSLLLDLDDSAIGEIDAINYVQDYGIGPQQREQLERMLGDPVFHQVSADSHESFAPIHAWRALGQIGDARSLPALFTLLLDPDVGDWDYDELPEIIGRFIAALPRTLEEHKTRFADPDGDETQVWALQRILALIAERDPTSRAAVIERLRDVVADQQMGRDTTRASAIACLGNLRAVECLPLIEQAFANEMVDTSYIGLPTVRKQMAGEKVHR